MGAQVGALSLFWGLPGWRGSWQAAYLAASFLFHVAASILAYPSLMTQGLHPTAPTPIWVMVQPPAPIREGGNVTFVPQTSSKDFARCSWYRERMGNLQELILTYAKGSFEFYITGEASTGRETLVPDCSLHISSLVPADDGVYTVHMDKGERILAIGHVILTVVGHETSHWSLLPRQDGNLVNILVGTFGAIAALFVAIGLSFWFCARCQKNSRPPAVSITPSAPPPLPPPLSPPPSYENIFPLGQTGPWVDSTASPESAREASGTSQQSLTKVI